MSSTGLVQAAAWLEQLEDRLGNLSPFMSATAEQVKQVSAAAFANQASPDGVRWPSLAPATLADREQQGYGPGPILVRTGTLRDSIQATIDMAGSRASVGSDMEYAAVHQFGNPDKPRVPARPYLGLPASSEPDIWKALAKHLSL